MGRSESERQRMKVAFEVQELVNRIKELESYIDLHVVGFFYLHPIFFLFSSYVGCYRSIYLFLSYVSE